MPGRTALSFTPKQGQYLAFIDAHAGVNRQPPAERDIQRFFGVAPPTVRQMFLTLGAQASSVERQALRAASRSSFRLNCFLSCSSQINRSKPLCRGTSDRADAAAGPGSIALPLCQRNTG
jgi:hypothetical protein